MATTNNKYDTAFSKFRFWYSDEPDDPTNAE